MTIRLGYFTGLIPWRLEPLIEKSLSLVQGILFARIAAAHQQGGCNVEQKSKRAQ